MDPMDEGWRYVKVEKLLNYLVMLTRVESGAEVDEKDGCKGVK